VQFGEIPTLLLDSSGIGQPQELQWLIDTNSEMQLPEPSKRRILSLIDRYRRTRPVSIAPIAASSLLSSAPLPSFSSSSSFL